MKSNSLFRTVMIGLFALVLLPVQAWGQAVDRAVEAADIGPLDVRISNMGPDGDVNFDALHPAVVYNSTDQQFMVVWAGDHSTDGDVEIFGQRLDALTGERLGQVFRISDMGPDGDPAFDAVTPAVAYNSTDNTYLVIWAGVDGLDGEGLYGQRLNAATGDAVGADDFRIADAMAHNPAVAYNDVDNAYLVAWQGQKDVDMRTGVIYGQRLNAASGDVLGGEALRISPLDEGEQAAGAYQPALAYNTDRNEYLVVWQADEAMTPRAVEIFGQRLNAATGDALDAVVRISDMGPDGDPGFYAVEPTVVYNAINHEYLVVWVGDDNTGGMADNEREVFGQRLDAATAEALGNNDFRISAMGPDGDPAFGAATPDVVFNPDDEEYLVVWRGDHDKDGLVEGAHEIFGQRIFGDVAAGDERGDDDFRISDMGSLDGNAGFDAIQAAVGYGKKYLAVWHGDDDEVSVDNEHEIFGRYLDAGAPLAIELTDFIAEADGKDVLLRWTTALEQDNVLFEVEHKTDEAFEVVGYTQEHTADAQQYTYMVEGLAPGRHTFRLRHTGPAGATLFSAEVEAIVEVPGGFLLTSAYPNPFNHSTTFSLTLDEQQEVQLAVFDMLGRKVATLHQGVIEAYQRRSFVFEAAALPSGSYFIRAVGETFTETKQMMLVR